MKCYDKVLAVFVAGVVLVTCAEEETQATFGKWRFAIGGGFNGAVRSSINMRNLPRPTGYSVPAGSRTQTEAKALAKAHEYGADGYIREDVLDNGWNTEYWSLSQDCYSNPTEGGDGTFTMRNSYHEVSSTTFAESQRNNSDDPYPFGVSFELSRELWLHDEAFDNRWGVDFAAAFSYYFQRDVYKGSGTSSRSDTVNEGAYETVIEDHDAMYDYDNGIDSPVNGMYGHGSFFADFNSPALLLSNIGEPENRGRSRTVTSSNGFVASGDYRELEMLFMFRPWYEITDWWRVFAQVGVGVSWGRFESDFNGAGIHRSETFDQWDCYGVAGLGTMFRYGMFDLSVDFFGRFLRDDLDVDGQYVHGTISRANWGFRVMAGVEF